MCEFDWPDDQGRAGSNRSVWADAVGARWPTVHSVFWVQVPAELDKVAATAHVRLPEPDGNVYWRPRALLTERGGPDICLWFLGPGLVLFEEHTNVGRAAGVSPALTGAANGALSLQISCYANIRRICRAVDGALPSAVVRADHSRCRWLVCSGRAHKGIHPGGSCSEEARLRSC